MPHLLIPWFQKINHGFNLCFIINDTFKQGLENCTSVAPYTLQNQIFKITGRNVTESGHINKFNVI